MSSTAGCPRLDAFARRAALTVVLACAAGCTRAGSAWSPDGGTIVFAFEHGERAALAACDLERGEVRALFGGGEHRFLRPMFDEAGERVVVAVEEGLAGACEILTLSPTGEELSRRRLEALVEKAGAAAQVLSFPMFVEGGALWFAWRSVDEPAELAYRRFDLDRNELTDDVLREDCIVLRRGDELVAIHREELDDRVQLSVGTRPLNSAEWSASVDLVPIEDPPLAVALGVRSLALVVRTKGQPPALELNLLSLLDGSRLSLPLADLGACGDAEFALDERELCLLAAKDGELWLHRVSTEDAATRSLRLFQANPLRTPPDELLALDATLSLSPDGTRLAVSVFSSAHAVGQPDLFVYELGDELRTVGRFHAPR